MNITLDESIEIYARAMRSWFGSDAPEEARSKAERARENGDEEGFDVWSKVAEIAATVSDQPRANLI